MCAFIRMSRHCIRTHDPKDLISHPFFVQQNGTKSQKTRTKHSMAFDQTIYFQEYMRACKRTRVARRCEHCYGDQEPGAVLLTWMAVVLGGVQVVVNLLPWLPLQHRVDYMLLSLITLLIDTHPEQCLLIKSQLACVGSTSNATLYLVFTRSFTLWEQHWLLQ